MNTEDYNSNNASAADELSWQAFLYVAGDLEGPELAKFEQRLETEQPAREAVAAAVETSQAVYCALSTDQHKTRRQSTTAGTSVGAIGTSVASILILSIVGTCACILTVAALFNREPPTSPESPDIPAIQPGAAELARTWNETRLTWDTPNWSDDESEAEAEDSAEFDFSILEEEPSVPAWMEIAVSASGTSQEQGMPEMGMPETEMPDAMPTESMPTESNS